MNQKRTLSQSVLFLVASLSLLLVGWQLRSARWALAASSHAALPALQGAAAVEHLKQQGLYASLNAAMTATQYGIKPVPEAQRSAHGSAYVADNPAQQLRASFAAQGLELRSATQPSPAWRLGMRLRSIGYGVRQSKAGSGRLTAQGNRIEYERPLASEHAALREWYVNTPTGLEQGFTVAEPPGARDAGEPLRLELALTTELQVRAEAEGQAVEFWDAAGNRVLRYDHLAVWDACGQKLAARMSVKGKDLRLEVKDAAAVYPVTIDPNFSQQAYLKASNTKEGDEFGFSVAVAGDTVVVGADEEDSNATGVNGDQTNNSAGNAGAAYVFVRSGTTWSQQAYLKASNTDSADQFGSSVAVAGDTVVVGAYFEASNATGVNGNQADNSAFRSGAAYVFVRSGTTWTQQAYLKASNTDSADQFGSSVAVAGDTVMVGAQLEDSNATGVNGNQADNSAGQSGAAYVFVRSGTTWSQQAYLKASNTEASDMFGVSVAVAGDTAVVGAYLESSNATGVNGNQANNSAGQSGAAYVFVRSGTTWSQQAYLKASNTGAGDVFGFSVAVAGDTVVVGAYLEASNATGVNGNQADNSATDAGAAYVFVRSGTTWSQQAYLKASNTDAFDQFGFSVAVVGDTVVVGAFGEASNATGVNGNQANNSANAAGAAYVFVRNGVTWSQQAYLKASNTEAADLFGSSVAVAGDTVVVGARFEDSNATGVNGNQLDNSANGAGAVYVFFTPPIVVTTLADEQNTNGQCSLREAIINANNNNQSGSTDCAAGIPALDTIQFNVGTGTPSIAVTGSALPAITEPVVIDGATGGATRVELNGAGAGAGASGLTISGGGSTLKTLVINRFGVNGVSLQTGGNNTVQGCFIGTNATGATDQGNVGRGIFIIDSANNLIGGTTAAARNVISGNDNIGFSIAGAASTGNQVQGNYIGVNAAGTVALSNNQGGISIGSNNNTIGGTAAGAGNVISGNGNDGIVIGGGTGNQVQGNFIGTNAAGTAAIENGFQGVSLPSGSSNTTVGGTAAGARNVISGNSGNGVRIGGGNNQVLGNYIGTNAAGTAAIANKQDGVNISDASGNTIGGSAAGAGNVISGNTGSGVAVTGAAVFNKLGGGNAIFANGALGIDLGTGGITANDAGDADTGANNLQNFPVLSFVTNAGALGGTLDSTVANSTYPVRLEFFANTVCDGTGNGEGEVFLGFVSLAAPGAFTFNFTPIVSKPFITATATDNNGNTSEISACRQVGDAPAQTLTVNTLADTVAADGFCSLREAITAANTNAIVNECNAGVPGLDNIVFALGAGTPSIAVTGSALPTVTEPLLIDGATGGSTRIELNGAGAGGSANGLTITGGNSTIKGLVINRFSLNGISIQTGGGNTIQTCFIGTNAAGTAAQANTGSGIALINNSSNNVIGGTSANLRNVVSGNGGIGVFINSAGATGNVILGNYIGTNAAGNAAVANSIYGVQILGPNNTLGGITLSARNVISGNGNAGVALFNTTATGNLVQANLIGLNAAGSAALPNNNNGVILSDAPNNTIGGTGARQNVIAGNTASGISISNASATGNLVQGNIIGADATGLTAIPNGASGVSITNAGGNMVGSATAGLGNVISGNTLDGVFISGATATGNQVLGNFIGVKADASAALGNRIGVNISGAPNSVIGGTTASARNIISGNALSGVLLNGATATNNSVQGNYIGTNPAGTAAVGNGSGGVLVTAANNTIGGVAVGAGNVISGNSGVGIDIVGASATGNQVQGNLIGTNPAGTAAITNTFLGVRIFDAANNTVGGALSTTRNVISGNSAGGMVIERVGATNNQVIGNFIGVNSAGTIALPNSGAGITIGGGATNNLIGTPAAGERNIISGNNGAGVLIIDPGSTGNQVRGNFIGLDVNGSEAVGNGSGNGNGGVLLLNTSNNLIGGPTASERNVISGNSGDGIKVDGNGAAATANVVRGNYIGTDVSGTLARANTQNGVLMQEAANNTIGGTTTGAGNTIAFNSIAGVTITNALATSNRVSGNSIHSNGGIGIDLNGDSVTQNDLGDADTGPNNRQNFPLLTAVNTTLTATTFQGALNSTTATTFRIEFFSNPACDSSGNGEGQVFLGFTEVTTNASGNATINITQPVVITPGHFVTATATNLTTNDTSEFSPCVCSFGFTPPTAAFTAMAGTGTFTITTAPACSWTVASSVPWITLTGNLSGTGNGVVTYAVQANPQMTLRTGTIDVTGPTLPPPNQTTPIAPNRVIVTQAGGTGMLIENETFGQPTFPPPGWVEVDGGTGGSQQASWVSSNTSPCAPPTIGPPFISTFALVDANCADPGIALEEQILTPPFNATGMGAVFVEFFNQFHASPGATGDVDVSTDGGLNWLNVLRMTTDDGVGTPTTKSLNLSPFIGLNAPNVVVRLHYYGTSPPRPARPTAQMTRRGRRSPTGELFAYWAVDFSIYGFSINPASNAFPAAGGTGSINVMAPSNRSWTAPCNVPWLSVAPSGGTGNATVNYTVQANPATTGRTGTCTVAGNIFTVNQAGTSCTPLTINPATLPNGMPGTSYSQTLTATGGTAPYTFAVTGGTLPNGLTLASTGALTGTPTTTGTFNFTVAATDANTCTSTPRAYTVLITGNGLQFYPLPSPVRALETRAPFSGCVNPGAPINANATLTLAVRTGCTGIPANALAVTGNVTVVPGAVGGFLTLFPSSATQPIVANSNFKPGEVTNNVFTTGLGAGDGAFKIFASATTEVIVDITGYYAPPTANGLYFHPLPEPVRLLETRTPAGLPGCLKPGAPLTGGQDFSVQGRSPVAAPCNVIPAAAQVLVGNATSVFAAGAGFLTLFPSDTTRPLIASSNYAGADIINGPFAVKLGTDGKFKVYTHATTDLVIDILGYYSSEASDANGAGLLFNPLDKPVRLLETRPDPGFPLTGCYRPNAKIVGGTGGIRTQQSWGTCESLLIPTTARAIIGNATVVNVEGAGFMTFYPGNVATAPTVATSNYPFPVVFGYNRHFVVGVSPADGTFKILTQATTDLIVDVAGYFAP